MNRFLVAVSALVVFAGCSDSGPKPQTTTPESAETPKATTTLESEPGDEEIDTRAAIAVVRDELPAIPRW